MTSAAVTFIGALDAEQKKTALLDYDTPKRVEWHFIPMDERKGLQIKHMTQPQRDAAHALLKAALSEMGYSKATRIMNLERLLNEFEAGKGRWARDHERYYFTLFGNPASKNRWGLSVEGHHLSLNFVVEDGRMISSSPQFFASNPAVVKNENNVDVAIGTRVLDIEETMAFKLVNSFTAEQKQIAIIATDAPKEIREAGVPQPPRTAAEGISYEQLTGQQRSMLLNLIEEYCKAMPVLVANQRINMLQFEGVNAIHFAWAGATEEGIGHYYKIQTPSSLIEFVNTQPDAAGNPANHIHCVWRNLNGDFALPVK